MKPQKHRFQRDSSLELTRIIRDDYYDYVYEIVRNPTYRVHLSLIKRDVNLMYLSAV